MIVSGENQSGFAGLCDGQTRRAVIVLNSGVRWSLSANGMHSCRSAHQESYPLLVVMFQTSIGIFITIESFGAHCPPSLSLTRIPRAPGICHRLKFEASIRVSKTNGCVPGLPIARRQCQLCGNRHLDVGGKSTLETRMPRVGSRNRRLSSHR
ncbi:hypothetical protein CPB85DRAFT_375088 [Mucidula mucida]|nr:hypothetical protein CPB85DRAFT_375088 [Mucidula mucida]